MYRQLTGGGIVVAAAVVRCAGGGGELHLYHTTHKVSSLLFRPAKLQALGMLEAKSGAC